MEGEDNKCVAIIKKGNRCGNKKKFEDYCGIHVKDKSLIVKIEKDQCPGMDNKVCRNKKKVTEDYCGTHGRFQCLRIIEGIRCSKKAWKFSRYDPISDHYHDPNNYCRKHETKNVIIIGESALELMEKLLIHTGYKNMVECNLEDNYFIDTYYNKFFNIYCKILENISEMDRIFDDRSYIIIIRDKGDNKANRQYPKTWPPIHYNNESKNTYSEEEMLLYPEINKIKDIYFNTFYDVTFDIYYWPFIADEAVYKINKAWRRYKTFFQKSRLNKIRKIQRWWTEMCYKPGGKLSLDLMNKSSKLIEQYNKMNLG